MPPVERQVAVVKGRRNDSQILFPHPVIETNYVAIQAWSEYSRYIDAGLGWGNRKA